MRAEHSLERPESESGELEKLSSKMNRFFSREGRIYLLRSASVRNRPRFRVKGYLRLAAANTECSSFRTNSASIRLSGFSVFLHTYNLRSLWIGSILG